MWKSSVFALFILLVSCGETNSSLNPSASNTNDVNPLSEATLAKTYAGAAASLTLSNGRLYFANSYTHDIHSISTNGGSLKTHYASFGVGGNVSLINGNLYFSGLGDKGVLSVPANNEGVYRLSETKYSSVRSVVSDQTYVYWSEYDFGIGRVVKAPINKQGVDPSFSAQGYSMQEILPFALSGPALLAKDNSSIFILDENSGKVYKSDLATNAYSMLTTVSLQTVTGGYRMVANSLYLYVLDGLNLLQIDKTTGQTTTVANGIDTLMTDFRADANATYWWQNNSLKRLDSTTGTITVLASNVFDGMAFGIDDTHIWWFSNGGNYQISRAPISVGATELIASYPSFQYQNPTQGSIYFDQNFIYWTGNGGASLYKLSKLGGTPTVISKAISYSSIGTFSANSTSLDWANSGQYIQHIKDKTVGQPDATSVWSFTQPPLSSATITGSVAMTSHNNQLYWTADKFDTADPLGAYALETYMYDGTTTTLIKKLYGSLSRAIMVDNSGIILSHTINTNNIVPFRHRLSAMSLTGSVLVDLVQSDTEIIAITLVNEVIYFIVSDGLNVGELKSYNLNTQTVATLSPIEPTTISGLYADATHVYWGDPAGVHRLLVTGGLKEDISTQSHALSITGDNTYIYWSDLTSIKRATK